MMKPAIPLFLVPCRLCMICPARIWTIRRQVQADFSGELINRRKIYPAKLKSYLPDIQFVRNKADYTDGNVGKKVVCQLLSKVREMCGLTEKEISDGKF